MYRFRRSAARPIFIAIAKERFDLLHETLSNGELAALYRFANATSHSEVARLGEHHLPIVSPLNHVVRVVRQDGAVHPRNRDPPAN